MPCERTLNLTNEKRFPQTIQANDYGLPTDLPIIIVFHDFYPSSFKLMRGTLPLLTKFVS